MKRTMALAILAAALAMPAAAREPEPYPAGEAQLTKMLAGRVPGKAVDCLPFNPSAGSTVIDRTAIVYDYGTTLYVNRPTSPDALHRDDILIDHIFGGQSTECRLDIVELRDRGSRMMDGSISLNSFVPYTRPKVRS